jgi:hypothetical protein
MGLIKGLETDGDTLLNTIANLKKINQIKIRLEKLIVDPVYKKALKKFVQSYNDIAAVNNQYFASITSDFTPAKSLSILKNTAVHSTINNLTEAGIDVNVTGLIKRILWKNISAGGSYADLTDQLRSFMLGNDKVDGALMQYAKTYTTTAVNQFSAEYNKSIADDLGLEWYVYTGSLLTTSRPFCIHAVDKKYIHISEFPALLQGDFGELGKVRLNKKTDLPEGMMEGTNPENFPRRRGGWNCGHQLIPIATLIVPKNVQDKVYASFAYKTWKAGRAA